MINLFPQNHQRTTYGSYMHDNRKCQILFPLYPKQCRSDGQMATAAYRQILCQSLNQSEDHASNQLIISFYYSFVLGLRNTAVYHRYKAKQQTTGATLILRTLKISGSKTVSDDVGPVINRNPIMTIAIPIASR